MNVIRLTFSIELVDQYYSKGKDTPILESFQTALGTANGQTIFNKVIANNPSFSTSTTRLQVSYQDVNILRVELSIYRSLMPLQLKQRNNKFTYTSTITSQKQCGVVARVMEILGGVTSTLTPITGSEVSTLWQLE